MSLNRTELIDASLEVIGEYNIRMTLRQLYYRLVARQAIPNNQSQYKRLSDVLSRARERGQFPWNGLEDRTRAIVGHPSTGDGDNPETESDYVIEQLAENTIWMPRWWGQSNYVEVWIEKQALQGVFEAITKRNAVVLMPCKGYPSATFLKEAGDRLRMVRGQGRAVNVIYFGDFDPSGMDIERSSKKILRRIHGIQLNSFKRIAITLGQIEEYNLPPDPTKMTDSRRARFIAEWGVDEAVELDAIDPPELQRICSAEIKKFWDPVAAVKRNAERSERQVAYEELLAAKLIDYVEEMK